ncbi:MFS hexose transporter [Colletotrichum karsti]|uniref:MFS hexose transporter n=1 Tax=Colletotrichum karsti TaxID=1095194 RepID=A0A9P6IDX5_9PEZI|nr:MFS hexose transporter [Colletotrichum karsti]KAF9880582.1 MFS hexose transporter [Colletotrichum karsti]
MVKKPVASQQVADNVEIARAEAPRFEKVYWLKEPHLRKLYFSTIFLMVASATTGYDGMLVNTSQQMQRWKDYFGDGVSDNNKLGILINMFNIGSIISFFITPYVADGYGRKVAIVSGCIFMVIGGCITAFCNGWGMYVGGRFILGFGNSLAQMSSPLLLTEICHPQHRGPVTAIYNCLWNLGALIVASIGWGTSYVNNDWCWRSITFIQIVPSVIQLIGIWWVPESPRYLINKDRAEEALAVLAKHHAGGDYNNATVQFEFREMKETITMERDADRTTSYIDFFKTKGNRWRLAIIISLGIISQYSGNALFSNYMDAIYDGAGIKNQNQKLAISTGKSILDLSCSIGAALTVDYFGRRPLFLTAITGMVASFVCWTITGAVYENSGSTNQGSGYAQLVFIWVFGIFYDIGFSGLLIAYALEVLPFHLRAKGMMIMNITVQAILAIGNQTNKVAWDSLPNHWNFMLFYTLWDFCELVFVYFFYVETKGPTLEEISKIFDGDAAVAHVDLHQVEKEIHDNDHEEDINTRAAHTEKTAV